jgi:hypothetical protein
MEYQSPRHTNSSFSVGTDFDLVSDRPTNLTNPTIGVLTYVKEMANNREDRQLHYGHHQWHMQQGRQWREGLLLHQRSLSRADPIRDMGRHGERYGQQQDAA